MIKPAKAIIFVKRSSLDFVIENCSQTLSLNLPVDVVRDQEIINPQKLADLIKSFIESNKITGLNVLMVVDRPLVFEKKLENLAEDKKSEEIQKFLDIVPFENVESKIIPIETGIKIQVINNNFFLLLTKILEKNGVNTTTILTSQELTGLIDINNQLNIAFATQVFKQFDSFNQQSFSLTSTYLPYMDNHMAEKQNSEKNVKLKRSYLPYLSVILIILFAVLIFMLLRK